MKSTFTPFMVLKLSKNLRKSLLRGHPWVYRQALDSNVLRQAQVKAHKTVALKDTKNQFVGWGYYDSQSPIAFRMVRLGSDRPNASFYNQQMIRALRARESFLSASTNCYRLFNGEGDGLPGLVCDVYNKVAVLQCDGFGAEQFWSKEKIGRWLLDQKLAESVIFKPRQKNAQHVYGAKAPHFVEVLENDQKFEVDLVQGQKTGFFLDQRDNRKYVQALSAKKNVLNLFSYTGGFSIYAASGDASSVVSVDISQKATEQLQKNISLNDFDSKTHQVFTEDVFEFIDQHKNTKWDLIIVDPPSMAPSESAKPQAIKKYIEIFAKASKQVSSGGDICFSSCSSHISFEDFSFIIQEALSQARCNGFVSRVSGQGSDHPFPVSCPELQYLKFVHVRMAE